MLSGMPHEWRLCRFCRVTVKNEVHVLLKCEANSELVALRAAFRRDVTEVVGEIPLKTDLLEQLTDLLCDHRLAEWIAKYIYLALELVNTVPMFIPAPYP